MIKSRLINKEKSWTLASQIFHIPTHHSHQNSR